VSNTYCVVFLFCFPLPCVHYCASFSGFYIYDNPTFFIWYSPTLIYMVLTFLSALHKHELFDTINTVVSNHLHSVKISLFSSAKSHKFDGMLRTGLAVSIYTTTTPIDMCRFNVRYTDSDCPFGIFKLFYIISYWKIKYPYEGVTGMLMQKNG
jgi:hypothetical protein